MGTLQSQPCAKALLRDYRVIIDHLVQHGIMNSRFLPMFQGYFKAPCLLSAYDSMQRESMGLSDDNVVRHADYQGYYFGQEVREVLN